jgi:hypothetical protein
MSSSFNNYSPLTNEYNWNDICVQLRINKHALPIITTKAGEIRFKKNSYGSYICFIVNLLTQHKFCCVISTMVMLSLEIIYVALTLSSSSSESSGNRCVC